VQSVREARAGSKDKTYVHFWHARTHAGQYENLFSSGILPFETKFPVLLGRTDLRRPASRASPTKAGARPDRPSLQEVSSTETEIARLRAEGVGPTDRVRVAHYFSHFGSSWSERQAFREALLSAGFGAGGEVDSDIEWKNDYYWHHWAFTVVNASEGELTRLDSLAQSIAAEQGAIYNSWRVSQIFP
jgi:hypothetical protein